MEHSRETGIGNAITSRSAETVSPGLEYNARDWGVSFGGSGKERDTNKVHRANDFGGGFNPLMQCNPHVCFAIFG